MVLFFVFGSKEGGFESRRLETVRWTVSTGVASPQRSESIYFRHCTSRWESNAGRWIRKGRPNKQSGGLFVDPWLFQRKANPQGGNHHSMVLFFVFVQRKVDSKAGLLMLRQYATMRK